MTSPILLVHCTCPDETTAAALAETLVRERLAACVNQLSGVRSRYLWQGEIHQDDETLLLIKTTGDRFAALASRLRALHPYDLPEILAVPVTHGLPDYLDWVRQCTSEDS